MKWNDPTIIEEVQRALNEDIGSGDVTAELLPADLQVEAEIITREPMMMCGQPWADCVFGLLDAKIKMVWQVQEGEWVGQHQTLCRILGPARSVVTGERTALNFLQTLSATATKTYHYVHRLSAYKAQLLDTRKTIPGLRLAQKYAVRCGGALNHRLGLYDAFLIKENHIKACGSIKAAVTQARTMNPHLLIEVEVQNLKELEEAFAAKPSRILLDNFNQEMLKAAVAMNQPKLCELEVSGGLDLETIETIAQIGIDYLSVGDLTKSIKAIDLSLLIKDIL